MRFQRSCNRVQTYRNSAAWRRLVLSAFPQYDDVLPDPSRLRLFPVSNRSVLQAWRCASQRMSGGRTDGR